MNNIQIKGVDSTLSQVVLEDIQYLKQHLDDILLNSDQTLIKNLIAETEFLLGKSKSSSTTYREKYNGFIQLTTSWFDAWKHYVDIPKAVDLYELIDRLTNFSMAYSYLFLSLSLINEDKTGEYKTDLERVVSGFLLLAEIVDIFTRFFSNSELEKICDGARNAISISTRDVEDYSENGLELSNLVTQLKAYSSLIILRVEEHINSPEKLGHTKKIRSSVRIGRFKANFSVASNTNQLRPFGLCAGEFTVPNDFDMPLPEEILSAFEG